MFKKYRDELQRLLSELKVLGAAAVKSEFEEEGADSEEVRLIKNISMDAGLKLALKLGGCSAFRDMKEAKQIGADIIVAPMVESAYALRKFLNGVCKFGLESKELYISIETINAFNTLKNILASHEFSLLDGVVFGRTDFGRSIDAAGDFAESKECMSYALTVLNAVKNKDKKFVLGGSVTTESLNFFEKLGDFYRFETRKIVFERSFASKEAIIKALEFEILWLKMIGADDSMQRINELEQRLLQL